MGGDPAHRSSRDERRRTGPRDRQSEKAWSAKSHARRARVPASDVAARCRGREPTSPMNRREFGAAVAGGLLSSPLAGSLGRLSGVFGLTVPRVDGARLNRRLTELSRFGANPQGGVTRLAYSDADKQAREYVLGLMRDAKL